MIKLKKSILSFVLFLLAASFSLSAQEEKENVLIIPFPSYHFLSSIDLYEVAQLNQISRPNEVYQSIRDSLVRQLSKGGVGYNLFEIPQNEYQSLKFLLNPEFKPDPTGRFGIDLKKLKESVAFKNMLSNLKVDYVLFLTNYKIDTKLYTSSRSFNGSYALSWSRHLLDYEFIDAEFNLIAIGSSLELKANNPTLETFESKGLLLKELRNGFRSVIKDFHLKKNQFQVKKKPQFRLKRVKKKSKN